MKVRLLLSVLILLALSAGAIAAPIKYISGTTIPTSFDGTTLTFESLSTPLIIQYFDNTDMVIDNTIFVVSVDLLDDTSSNGIVSGVFSSGVFELRDENQQLLLGGTISQFNLREVFDNIGILAANGTFYADSGDLLASLPYHRGFVYDITFEVDPIVLNDLNTSFSGVSNITFATVPEPTTLVLLGSGLIGIFFARKRRS